MNPSHIVISSGPGTPQKAGLCMDIIKNFYKKIPILGVGLGHQCIGLAFGAKLIQSKKLSHGKTSIVMHKGMNIFEEIKNPMRVGRYHSLVLDMDTISDCFEIAAITEDKEVMAIFHKEYPLVGVQFNPESINTPEGQKIIENFLKKELI